MAEEYPFNLPESSKKDGTTTQCPFDLPDSSVQNIEQCITTVWERYGEDWSAEDKDPRPFALECLHELQRRLGDQNALFAAIIDYHCSDCVSEAGKHCVQALHDSLGRLIDDFGALLALAVETLPHDPKMRRLIEQADNEACTEIEDLVIRAQHHDLNVESEQHPTP